MSNVTMLSRVVKVKCSEIEGGVSYRRSTELELYQKLHRPEVVAMVKVLKPAAQHPDAIATGLLGTYGMRQIREAYQRTLSGPQPRSLWARFRAHLKDAGSYAALASRALSKGLDYFILD